MGYLITSIKEIEDLITPSLEIDDLFNPFIFPKLEEKFRSCMRLYRIETFGEDYEKFPISFEEFNPNNDKFYGMNYDHLNEIVEINEFKIDLIKHLNGCEDSFVEDIFRQLPNPSEAEFKMFLYACLKNLQDSYRFLYPLEIKNNAIINLVKDELIESYKRAFEKARNEVPIYDDMFNSFLLDNENLNTVEISNSIIPFNDQSTNPFPRIFKDFESFLFFEELKNKLCTNENSLLADFSFVFRIMQRESYIFNDVTEKAFRIFLTDKYEITFDKLKTYEYCLTEKKIQLYNSLKK